MPPLRHPPLLTAVVADDLRRAIDAGEFEGGQLPSEPELARRMGISRATLRQAITELEEAGLVRRRHGKGTFVTGHAAALRNILNENSGTSDLIRAAGWLPTTTDVVPTTRPATSREVQALALQPRRRGPQHPPDATGGRAPGRGRGGRPALPPAGQRGHRHRAPRRGAGHPHVPVRPARRGRARGPPRHRRHPRRPGAGRHRPPAWASSPARRSSPSTRWTRPRDGSPCCSPREWYAPDVFQFRVYRRGPGSRR